MKNAMNFRPVGLMLLFCLIPLWAFAQSVMVKGVVKDTSGEAIIGASVLEKGTTNGTITDFDGNFALNVSKNAVLVVSFVGYKNEEISVAGKSSLKITLKEYKPQNKMFRFYKTFCSRITLINTNQNVILNPI